MTENFKVNYNKEKFRLTYVQQSNNNKSKLNWLFLPGGPGLGSEYFLPYLNEISLPGDIWRGDFPGDGSNRINGHIHFESWQSSLIDAISNLANVILVTHSFSAMFALTVPKLEEQLTGFVVMDSAPNNDWMAILSERAKKYHLPDRCLLQENYQRNKSDDSLKAFTNAGWQYFMSAQVESEAKIMLSQLPYNHKTYDWAQKNFHPNYQVRWVPNQLPTLVLGGQYDMITPIELFQNDPSFKRDNIIIKVIADASHFPWMEQPKLVEKILQDFALNFRNY